MRKKDEKKVMQALGAGYLSTANFKKTDFSCLNCQIDTSETLINDTASIYLNDELVIFRDPVMWAEKLPDASYLSSKPVSVRDYKEFMKYVEDSNKIELIINSFDDQITSFSIINPDPKELERVKLEKEKFLRKIKPNGIIDWNYPINWNDEQVLAAIAHLNLPQPERFYRKIEVDGRYLVYRYNYSVPLNRVETIKNRAVLEYYSDYVNNCELRGSNQIVENITGISPDLFKWGTNIKKEFDVYDALAYTYGNSQNQNPVIGITGMQAQAFCDWKSKEIQKTVDSYQLPYEVKVSLPTEKDIANTPCIKTLSIPSINLSDQWRISASNYKEFVDHVLDSIVITRLYADTNLSNERANKLIHFSDSYFDDGSLTIERFNPNDRELNLSIFQLNYENSSLFKSEIDSIKKAIILEAKFYYMFHKKDFKNMSLPGGYWWDSEPPYGFNINFNHKFSRWFGDEEWTYLIGENLDRSNTNCLGFSDGVREFENLQQFIISWVVNPLEGIDYASLSRNVLPEISYEQAKAYYIWKSKLWTAGDEFNYSQFIYPSEVEFRKIQNGEEVKSAEVKLELPAPTFRYVVHLYKK
jgi:hypothetical protein